MISAQLLLVVCSQLQVSAPWTLDRDHCSNSLLPGLHCRGHLCADRQHPEPHCVAGHHLPGGLGAWGGSGRPTGNEGSSGGLLVSRWHHCNGIIFYFCIFMGYLVLLKWSTFYTILALALYLSILYIISYAIYIMNFKWGSYCITSML